LLNRVVIGHDILQMAMNFILCIWRS